MFFRLVVAVIVVLCVLSLELINGEVVSFSTDEQECDESFMSEVGDHILFHYKVLDVNGTVLSQSQADKQLPHLVVTDTQKIPFDFRKLCPTTTRTFSLRNGALIDTMPSIGNKLDIHNAPHGSLFSFTAVHITKQVDFEIFNALQSQNISLVLDLVQAKQGINALDEWGQSPLMVATIQKYLPVVAELMNARSPRVAINYAKPSGYTALLYALHYLDASIFNMFLKRGANPNVQLLQEGSRGNTPLHYAVLLEKSDHVEHLLNAGAHMDAINQFGKSPLQMLPDNALPSTKTYIKKLFEVTKRRQEQQQ